MPDLNFNYLQDRVKDVDPDIRFMALEDLRKYLNDETVTSSKSSISYHLDKLIPTLLTMLDDPNPDVQNQVIKSFEPMVRYLSNDSILSLVKELFALVQASNDPNNTSNGSSSSKTRNFRSFTISIPNMALRSLFAQSNSRDKSDFVSDKLSKSNYKFDRDLAKKIFSYILPKVFQNEIAFDNIELLIDLISEIGYALSPKQNLELAQYFIQVSFTEQGIIGKKAIVGAEHVIALIDQEHQISTLVDSVSQQFQASSLPNKSYIMYQLLSVVIRRRIKPSQVADIFDAVTKELYLDLHIGKTRETHKDDDDEEDEEDEEELDLDILEKQNALKEEAFTTLIDLVDAAFLPIDNKNTVLDVIQTFLQYDPLNQSDDEGFDIGSEEQDEEDGDDIDFSEDELEAVGEEENDGSWKLRLQASILSRVLIKSYPDTLDTVLDKILPILPIKDSNDQVVSEAVRSCIAIIHATSPRDAQPVQSLFEPIIERLNSCKEELIPVFLKLVESLNRFDNTVLIEASFKALEKRNINSSSSLEYLQFFTSVLKFHDDLSNLVINKIGDDIAINLEDKSFNMIIESLKCLKILLNHKESSKIANVEKLVSSLVTKVENRKQYPSELIRLAIEALGATLTNTTTTTTIENSTQEAIFDVLKSSISYEVTSKATLDVLNNIYTTKTLPDEYSEAIVDGLEQYILSANEATSTSALILLNKLALQTVSDKRKKETIISSLLKLLPLTNASNHKLIFEILTNWSQDSNESEQTLLADVIINLVNSDKILLHDESFFNMIRAYSQNFDNKVFYDKLASLLNPNLPVSAKISAIGADNLGKETHINAAIEQLHSLLKSNINDSQIAVAILFLAFANDDLLDVNELIELLRKENFTNEDNVKAVSTAIGLKVQRNPHAFITPILEAYKAETRSLTRSSLVEALRLVVDSCDQRQKTEIWDAIFSLQNNDFDPALIPELRKTGDVLGEIALSLEEHQIQQVVENQVDRRKIYLVLVFTKYLISNLELSNTGSRLLTYLVNASVEWLDIVDLDLRKIALGNLLTGIHIKPLILAPLLNSIILPKLAQQLSAEKDFKKIITMGPYKYTLDQGAELRKLCYEFIYSVMAADDTSLVQHDVDIQLLGKNIIEKGLLDDQPDIVVLACSNLGNFFDLHEMEAMELIRTGGTELIEQLVGALNKQLSKKLSAKASAQDTEIHQERIKSIVKLSKKIDLVLESTEIDNDENRQIQDIWNKFITDIKQQYTVYYSSTVV
ncbi:hypothetical protein PVL30_003803 [Lodderomyces elongisporus]|uniref:uncharacterized protein n=1 Tax=Lodderomyces elongisporus TaxID=36914 RepID=UPI002922FBE4|nr:uncharacterized protein PVL30_003803 [Lodderomyces elongisporus]WLF80035.1 hypothetical protein PVL30_003803 [Lodderomyces elongisporus]